MQTDSKSNSIIFKNWTIYAPIATVGYQYDNLSRVLMVEGNLPEGYRWDMLVQHEDNLDIIGLSSVSENCASAVLSSAQLCYEGIYQMQLRGTLLSDLKTKRHTNVIFVHIPRTIIGDGTWNVVPTSFIEIEQNILKANAHPPIPGD